MLTQAIAIIGLLFISAFASSSETAFFSLNRFQLRRLKERFGPAYLRVRTLLARPSRFLILLLLMNEVVNITISTFVTEILSDHVTLAGRTDEARWTLITLLSLAFTIPALLLFGEITPKVIAAKMNRLVSITNSKVLIVLYRLLLPVLWSLDMLIGAVLSKFKAEGKDHLAKTMSILTEEDFMVLMEEGHREGTVDPAEKKLIQNIFEFEDTTVEEVMTPISAAFSVSAQSKISDVFSELRLQKFSRIPVYQKSKKSIVGILYIKDLLALRNHPELQEAEIKSLMTKPMTVSPDMRLSKLFRRLKQSKTHMAVVRENDESVGVVTMEDVLESIFGEISDERDTP